MTSTNDENAVPLKPLRGGASFPKRFYATVGVAVRDQGFALLLDDKPARTPAKSPILLPTRAAAQALADEWSAVGKEIDPRCMPLTRLVNSVIDGVSRTEAAVFDEIVRYASSDLLVYRATEPADLVRSQQALWDPVLAWSRDLFDAPFTLADGIVFVEQPQPTLERFAAALRAALGAGPCVPFRLGALHVMTTLSGSAVLALAVAALRLAVDQAWTAAHVDEDYQIARWGQDTEAAARRATRWTEMQTAAYLFELVFDQ